MIQPPTGEDDGIVSGVVRGSIPEIASENRHGVIEKRCARFTLPLHAMQETIETSENSPLDPHELPDLLRVTPMVGQVVVFQGHAIHPWNPVIVLDDDAGGSLMQ